LSIKRWPADKIERRAIDKLIPYANNARTHSEAQVAQIAASMREWGWTNPVLVDEDDTIIAGHGRVLAARQLGIDEVPVMVAGGWSDAQKKAYVLADNKLALNGGWDDELLKIELTELEGLNFDLGTIGFDGAELSAILGGGVDISPDEEGADGSGVDGEFLKFGRQKIALAEDELQMLNDLVTQYVNEFGLANGFARWLCEGNHVAGA
jgi:hypothetical protein